ncbi:type I glutamate--ammonia ligase [Rhizobium leguminosarum]|uniref:Type I glutamate--ammonia ligase n=1 Tax=Rhizobium leguminosarum TaxID=384 RepID=A0A444HIC3_RHILE|nr:type I glutamate--ammonia ligase [Rhizobium leguminosarum]RWX21164.1 type I glutamate--ammonia ligase [Rhizobium leguminosarum]
MAFKSPADVLKFIKDNDIQELIFSFTDTNGALHVVSYASSVVNAKTFSEGVMFDGSSLKGWTQINESDMVLHPDPTTARVDPFCSVPTLKIICDITDPGTGKIYNRDPRGVARRAEAFVKHTGIADKVVVGPEPEFFVFDHATYGVDPHSSFSNVASSEWPNSDELYKRRGLSHHMEAHGGYLASSPRDLGAEMRSNMMAALKSMDVIVEKHHHETAPGQHEIGIKYNTLVRSADEVQILKDVVKNVAKSYGRSATFMPKPDYKENGSGMHLHYSMWKSDKPLFAGAGYAGLSELGLWFTGGVKKHIKALNALTNPSTNSYRRLVPGFEAPVVVAHSSGNRSAACRIPWTTSAESKRVEFRFPDPAANPYLAYAGILMAGMDGILNQIDPGEAMDKDLYKLPPTEKKMIPHVCASLREALDNLDKDRDFLKVGGVFDDDLIDAYIELKKEEIEWLEKRPTPGEFVKYYSV